MTVIELHKHTVCTEHCFEKYVSQHYVVHSVSVTGDTQARWPEKGNGKEKGREMGAGPKDRTASMM